MREWVYKNMTILNKKWTVAEPAPDAFLNKYSQYSFLILQLLYNRGIDTQDEIEEFFNPNYLRDLFDPMLFKNMNRAIDRIARAYNNKERVAIYGDYDADGVTSSVLLMELFRDILKLQGQIYIPDRLTEGYGMNSKAIEWLKEKNIDLIITCDCGVSNKKEIDYAKKLGMDTIVTDHHSLPHDFSDKYIVINSKQKDDKYPYKELAGVGIVFKLTQAIIKNIKKFKSLEIEPNIEKKFLDLVAIGTIADCSPIISENRTLVKYGIEVLKKTPRKGLNALYDISSMNKKDINTYAVGFVIAPRINAAGRLDHANAAYKMLATNDDNEAYNYAKQLNQSNISRQQITERITREAKNSIGEVDKNMKLITAVGDGWPTGVVGIVAGKISEEYNRPVLIAGKGEIETVGSARSIDGFNIIEAISQSKDILTEYGGHKKAAGFSLKNENLIKFFDKIRDIANEKISDDDLISQISIDKIIQLDDVSWELFEEISMFEPYGIDNNKPLFQINNLKIKKINFLGKDKRHIKIEIENNNSSEVEIIGFNFGKYSNNLKEGDIMNIVAEININEWNGSRKLQIIIRDIEVEK